MKIKPIPWWGKIVFIRGAKGFAFMGTIYLSENFFALLSEKEIPIELEALLAHEDVHCRNMKSKMWTKLYRYFTNSRYRLQEEIQATKAEIAVYCKHGLPFDYESRANSWSSLNYLFMVDYREALEILRGL